MDEEDYFLHLEEQRYYEYITHLKEQHIESMREELIRRMLLQSKLKEIGQVIYTLMQNNDTFENWLLNQSPKIEELARKYPPKEYYLTKAYGDIDISKPVKIIQYFESGEIRVLGIKKILMCDEIKNIKHNIPNPSISINVNPIYLGLDRN